MSGAPLDTILRVPPRARGHRAPLILALHFASGTGAQMEQATRYTPQAARSGFAVAYPTASANHFWSIDGDLDKLAKTLDAVERVACIDPSRVYVSGISNGGFMATVLACRMAGRIAAAALFAPAVSGFGDCSPRAPDLGARGPRHVGPDRALRAASPRSSPAGRGPTGARHGRPRSARARRSRSSVGPAAAAARSSSTCA